MEAADHDHRSGAQAWRWSTIAGSPHGSIYTTSGVVDDNAQDRLGVVSSTHIKHGRIRPPGTNRGRPGTPPPHRATLQEGDLAVVLVRRTGETAFVTAEHAGWTATRSVGIIRAEPHVVRWLNIWLQTPTARAWIDEDVTAHVEPTMSLETLRRMPFLLPPSDDITHYHSAFAIIEEMIDLHQAIARNAVDLADAIHGDWSGGGTDWDTRWLGDIAKARTGQGSARSLPPATNEPRIDVITPSDLLEPTMPHGQRHRLSTPADAAEAWPPGTLVLCTRPDGAYIAVTQHPAALTRGVVAVSPADDRDSWWLFHELRSRSGEIARLAQGGSAREISARALSRLSVTWPDANTRADFHSTADPLHATAKLHASTSATLHDLKDALLRDISAKAEAL